MTELEAWRETFEELVGNISELAELIDSEDSSESVRMEAYAQLRLAIAATKGLSQMAIKYVDSNASKVP